MAKICVYLHGELISELALIPDHEYFVGRASTSDIHLASERGISRQHVKIFEQDGDWHAVLLSKYGGLILDGAPIDAIVLKGVVRFSIPPYDFTFEEAEVIDVTAPLHKTPVPEEAPSAESNESAPDEEKSAPDAVDPTPSESQSESPGESPNAALDEHTVLAQPARLTPYLKIVNNKLKTEEVLKLEGSLWQVGRAAECEIVLNDSAISRRHLEISNIGGEYFVTDHGSSNGTNLNGLKIEPNRPQPLQSGDVLSIRHLEIVLELHNNAYENQKDSLPVTFDTTNYDLQQSTLELDENSQPGMVVKVESHWNSKLRLDKNMKKRILPAAILVVVSIVVVALIKSPSNSNPTTGSHDSASRNGQTLSQLTPEQKKQVVDYFNLAHSYYTERKYTLCLSQLERMTKLTPFYLNSSELENLCQQGQEDQARALDREREQQEQQKTDSLVQANVAKCRGQLNSSTTTASMRSCLEQALELDPSNAAVTDLLNQAQIREQQAQNIAAQAKEVRRRQREGKELFNSAESSFHSGDERRALDEFRRFKDGGYPGLNQENSVATRRIASIERTIQEKFAVHLNACQSDIGNDELKPAIVACNAALNERPGDGQAQSLKQKAVSRLTDEMRDIYQDSILEENMGNINSAKSKWIQILHRSVPGEDYYEKAKQKLLDYGVEL